MAQYGIVTLQYDLPQRGGIGLSRLSQNGSSNTRTAGVPDTVKLPIEPRKRSYLSLDKNMQLWMHQLCRERIPSMSDADAKRSWRSLFMGGGEGSRRSARAFSNNSGSNISRDFVNNTNKDAEPIRIEFILTGGAFVHIIGEKTVAGIPCYKIEAINPKSKYTLLHPTKQKHLFFYPTISVRIPLLDAQGNPNGKYIEYVSEPFGQYNGNTVMPIWARPGENYQYVPKNRVTLADEPKNPFRPCTEPGYETYPYPNPYV